MGTPPNTFINYEPSTEFLRKHKGLLGRTSFYKAITSGEIPHVRIGRRILVPANALDLLLVRPSGERDGDADSRAHDGGAIN